MTTYGTNMKLTVADAHREALNKTMSEVFGCDGQSPSDNFTVFVLDDGFNLGVYFADEGLDGDAYFKAPWLELRVDDIDRSHATLTSLGVEVVPYPQDADNKYWRLPGGPVFRLASSSS